ncbi:carbonic anhydrase-related protein 10-like isoform X2 [Dermacentor andersoni]|uniref:carbonic anhydrase-related protein 10-like isoform X2 n=1 Tax=Dermacentor andersoni TaxID=34620 RepID=UPI0021553FFD|nr:carbonic anhydrase-related protein 10-like isoform X2 [Dermacentor andersoni]
METTTTEPPVLLMLLLFGCLASLLPGVAGNWDDWWTYEGISGPDFWGRLNPAWSLCSTGRRQSPVNIEPRQLLFDPNLKPIAVSNHRVDGLLQNTGQGIVFRLSEDDELGGVNISLGPLSYRYRVYELRLHFGRTEDRGSEHSVSGFVFPAELQILGYNCDLYANVSEARQRAQGLVALAVIIKLRDSANVELRLLTSQLLHLAFKGSHVAVKSVSIRDLLPDTDSYMTYEGSSTTPGCEETVTWILMNRPLYMTRQQDCPGMQVNKFYQANLDLLSR